MTPWLDDGDVRLYHGDALDVLRGLPDGSVDCVVTSPPYWGLRDYGTGAWAGGDPGCDHRGQPRMSEKTNIGRSRGKDNQLLLHAASRTEATVPFRDVCGKCGATRVDQQLGLEPTPDLFVQNMVAVFREVRRVLADHGTCWVNLGDSYHGGGYANHSVNGEKWLENHGGDRRRTRQQDRINANPDLKPKDLVGIPWRVAFALQADGWWLRSAITWCKPNCMPESVTDRPTKATEMVFLLTKAPRYWYDAEAVREPHAHDGRKVTQVVGGNGSIQHRDGERWPGTGRNQRDWWQIATQPYPEAHFATFPEELARRCIVAGCPTRVCRVCGKPSERIVDVTPTTPGVTGGATPHGEPMSKMNRGGGFGNGSVNTLGWSDCGCMPGGGRSNPQWRPGVTLDPFVGSGTAAKVARDHQRHAIGIDLSETYLELAARRLQQLSLLNAGSA